jgi:hypothetical protein
MIVMGSRYSGIDAAAYVTADGRTIAYLRRRFVSPPERFALLQEHVVRDGDRPDLLAYQYLGDPEQYWRIADANAVFWPEELTDLPARLVRITLPEGIPGTPANA